MTSKTTRVGALAGAAALALTACGDDGGSGEYNLIEEGTLTVCSDLPYGLFEFEDESAPSGYSGFDIDLVQEIADRLELELQVIDTSFEAIESGTAMEAQCDLAASAMTITDERAENIAFSDSYYDSAQSLLLPDDSDAGTLADFSGDLGVQASTTGAEYAQENAPEGIEIVEMPDESTLRQAIEGDTIQGILQDLPVNAQIATELDGYAVVETYETGEQYGFGMNVEGRDALVDAVNEQLSAIRDDGTYDEIYGEYFGTSE